MDIPSQTAAAVPGLHCVLLAAGSAKQQLPIEGEPMVRRAALAALATGAEVIVVTGAHADAVEAALGGLALTLLHNQDWEHGMGSSLACAFRHLVKSRSTSVASLICLADQPRIGAGELRQLIEAHRRSPQRIIAADHGATLGPPCLFPQRYYDELAALSGPQGARKLLQHHADNVETLRLPQAAIDIDTPDDYQRFLQGLPPQA